VFIVLTFQDLWNLITLTRVLFTFHFDIIVSLTLICITLGGYCVSIVLAFERVI